MQASQLAIDECEARTAPRTHLYLSATIAFDGCSVPVRVRDLSPSGARIEGALLPVTGAEASLQRGQLQANGKIVWRDSQGCGIRFDQPLRLERWVSPGSAPATKPAVHSVEQIARLPARVAEELAYVARIIESLGDDLSADPLVVARYSGKLQYFDISAQILGHLANVLVAEQPLEAVAAIGMENLRKRLQRVAL